jgi:SIR2-like domain
MPIEVSSLVAGLRPDRTVLLFGAGSSLPSNAPSVLDLQSHFERVFNVPASGYTLAEQTAIIEHQTHDRPRLVTELRARFKGIRPTGALLNLPLYNWKSIFTTNYDELIENCYDRRSRPAYSYSSNFDFGIKSDPDAVQIFKLHGTINQDVVDGNHSRIVLTLNDYDLVYEFREQLFDKLKADIAGSHLIIIGHSLADPDIKTIVDRSLDLNTRSGGGGRITIFSYTRDPGRATLFESRGLGFASVAWTTSSQISRA